MKNIAFIIIFLLLLFVITPLTVLTVTFTSIFLTILFHLHKAIDNNLTGKLKTLLFILLFLIGFPITLVLIYSIFEAIHQEPTGLITGIIVGGLFVGMNDSNFGNNDNHQQNYIPPQSSSDTPQTPNTKPTLISTIQGNHVYGLSSNSNQSIKVLLYDDSLVFMDGTHKIETIMFDEYIEVEARLKEVVVGTTTVAHKEVGLASTIAALKGDWLAAMYLSPNKTTYTTRPDIESYWALWIETSSLYVLQIDSESKLRKFVDSCNTAIDAYQAKQLLEQEPEEQTPTKTYPISQHTPQIPHSNSHKISIDKMTGIEFEEFCTKLLSLNGFINVIHTGGPNDQGADIVATKDGIKYVFQCKCYSSPLGNTPVQEALAGKQFRKCHIGIVITNSTFTKGAIELADSTQIILWDKFKLKELLYNTNLKDEYNL